MTSEQAILLFKAWYPVFKDIELEAHFMENTSRSWWLINIKGSKYSTGILSVGGTQAMLSEDTPRYDLRRTP